MSGVAITSNTCSEVADCCICFRPPGHDDAHECACGGSWSCVDGKFTIHVWPGGVKDPDAALAALLGELKDPTLDALFGGDDPS